MTVEQKIKKIVDSMEGVSYLFDNWQTANIRLDKIKLPAVLNLLPVSGTFNLGRSEERRVGKECRIGCRSRWSPYH